MLRVSAPVGHRVLPDVPEIAGCVGLAANVVGTACSSAGYRTRLHGVQFNTAISFGLAPMALFLLMGEILLQTVLPSRRLVLLTG